jgi:hypothetical protein
VTDTDALIEHTVAHPISPSKDSGAEERVPGIKLRIFSSLRDLAGGHHE